MVHMSSLELWLIPKIISGEKYSGVPQKVFRELSLIFDHPKSATFN